MITTIISNADTAMLKTVTAFQHDLSTIRTGRATIAVLDGILVDYYGTPTPINQVATIAVLDAHMLTVTPWEASIIPEIEKTIFGSNRGLSPSVSGNLIRVPVPALTQERRKEMVKQVKLFAEDARIAVRKVRRDGNSTIKESKVSEDDIASGQKKMQDLTDKHIASIDTICSKKETDLLQI